MGDQAALTGPFESELRSALMKLPMNNDRRAAVWDAFYDASAKNDDVASLLDQSNVPASERERILNWRTGLFGGPNTTGVLAQQAQKTMAANAPAPTIGELAGRAADIGWRNVIEPALTGAGNALAGMGELALETGKSALGLDLYGRQIQTPEDVQSVLGELNKGVIGRGVETLYRKTQLDPARQLFEKAAQANQAGRVPERVAYNLLGMASLVPAYGAAAPMVAHLAESIPASYEQGTPAPFIETAAGIGTGVLVGKAAARTPAAVRAITTEPREVAYRMYQRIKPTEAGRDLSGAITPPPNVSRTPEMADKSAAMAMQDMKFGEEILGKKVGANPKASSADILKDSFEAAQAASREFGKYMDVYESADVRPPTVSAEQLAADLLKNRPKSALEESAAPDADTLAARAMFEERASAVRGMPNGQWTIRQIIDELHHVNQRLQTYRDASKSKQLAMTAEMRNGANLELAYRDALQLARDQAMDAVDSAAAKDIYKRYGNLQEWKGAIARKFRSATGESLYDMGDLVADVSMLRTGVNAIDATSLSSGAWQLAKAALIRGTIKALKGGASPEFGLVKGFEKAKPSTLPNLEKLFTELKEKAGQKISAEFYRGLEKEQARLAQTPALPPALADQVKALRQAVDEKRAAYQQAKREVESAQRSLSPEATQLKQELGLTQRPIDTPALSQALDQSYMDYAQALRQLRELEAQQPSLGRTMGVEPGTELVREYPPVAEPFLGGIPEAEVARRANLIPEAPGAVSERYAQQAAAEQASAASEAALADAQFRQRVEARALADQMAREAELSARADESMFRDIQTRGTTGATRRMGEEQRVFERTQREAEQQQRELSRLEASAKRTELAAIKAQRVQEAEQARKQAEQRLKEAQREEQRRRAELRGAKKAEETPKAEKPEKPKTAEEQALADARAKREQAAAELKASQQAAREARRASTTKTEPTGKILMFMGQPIRLTGKTSRGYEEFKFVDGPNKNKLGYRKIER